MDKLLGSEKLVGEENEERMRMNVMLKIKKKDVDNMVEMILKAAASSAPSRAAAAASAASTQNTTETSQVAASTQTEDIHFFPATASTQASTEPSINSPPS